jgi:hypothetical protein
MDDGWKPEAGKARPAYAAERWARAICKVVAARDDPRTLAIWGRLIGVSPGSLATWCRAARVSPRRSLDLARLARALVITRGSLDDLHEVLDIVEPRTMRRLLARAGISCAKLAGDVVTRPTLHQFLEQQQLVANRIALEALSDLLSQSGISPPPDDDQHGGQVGH